MSATASEAIAQRMLGQSSVTALVGTRIRPQWMEQASDAASLPYIVYRTIDETHDHHLGGATGVAWARVQLDIYGLTYASVKAIASAIRLVLDGFRGSVTVNTDTVQIGHCFLDLSLDEYEPPIDGQQKGRHRIIQDWKVGFYESIPAYSGV